MCQFTYCTLSSTGHLRSRARPLPAERLSAITHAVQFQLGEGGVRKNYTKCTLILAHILSGALLCHLSPQHTRRKTSASRQLTTTVHHTGVSTVLAGRGALECTAVSSIAATFEVREEERKKRDTPSTTARSVQHGRHAVWRSRRSLAYAGCGVRGSTE